MTQRDRTVVLVLLVGVLLAGAWFGLIGPRRDEAAALGEKITQAQARLDTASAAAAAALKVKEGYRGDYAAVTKLGKAVPEDDDVPSLLVQVSRAAGGAKVDFRSIKLTASTAPAAPVAAPPVAQAAEQGKAEGKTGTTSTTPTTREPAPAAPGTPPADPAAGAAAPGTATATAAAAAALPPGATIGPAGFPVLPFAFEMDGSYFRLRTFLKRIDDFIRLDGRRIDVKGRLMTLDGFTLADGKMSFSATAYVLPVAQGLTAGATPAAPGTATTVPTAATGAPPAAPATPPAATAVPGSR